MKLAVQFGAGNIGRGFIAHLLWESGFTTVLVESQAELVKKLQEQGKYPLRLLSKTGQEMTVVVDRYLALATTEEDEIASQIAQAGIVFTAVGVKNLAFIAPHLARGIEKRKKEGGDFLNVLLCENRKDAPLFLKEEVKRYLPASDLPFLEEKIGFVGTVVARMVPQMGDRFGGDDPLLLVAEDYHRLPYDALAVKGSIPSISGLLPVKNFPAEMERKLFIHNLGHAVCAYLGYLKGYSYIHQSVADPEVENGLMGSWEEVSRALLHKYPDLDPEEQETMVKDLKERFANPLLMDTVQRVARDPLRKLGPEDRLIGGARLCLSQGIFPERIAEACGAALCYDWPEDTEAVALQKMIAQAGVEKVLKEVSGVEPSEPLAKKIVAYYTTYRSAREKKNT